MMRVTLAVAVLTIAAGCTGGNSLPARAQVGLDACEYCHMVVSNADRAAAFVPETGPTLVFDEPGFLAAWLRRNPERQTAARFHDHHPG